MRAAVLHGAKDLRVEEVPDQGLGTDEVRVRFRSGGICGSDLSYYFKGRVGDFALCEPLILGHEAAGEVIETGAAVDNVAPGDHVTLNPSRPCRTCDYCRHGRSNLCRNMRFFGSAALRPHVQGAFREAVIARADQCHKIPESLSWAEAACAEPLSVALHGVARAGDLFGKTVIVAGAGPIGSLLALVAKKAGAHVTITDVVDHPLQTALTLGVDETINVATAPEKLAAYEAGKGHFDVGLEATGVVSALAGLFRVVRPGGRIVQLGAMPPGDIPLPANLLMAREIDYVGAFRFHEEFAHAVRLLSTRSIDITPILSAEVPMDRADEAFRLAADRTRALKVTLVF
ncbi:MAG: L-idonate 5-dehydrogenase [Alphaproteobacteria bacterium]